MAFHPASRQVAQRAFRHDDDDQQIPQIQRIPTSVEESQTWVLFPRSSDAATTTSYLTSTQESIPTPGRSRLSDLGSYNTVGRSDNFTDQHGTGSLVDPIEEDEDEDDDGELDSLDSHLPDFRTTPTFNNSSHALPHTTTVLPSHNGLGSFHVAQEGLGDDAQDRLYAFEQYNPRRVKRRRESLEIGQLELESEQVQEIEKMRRIEAWRLDQSRALLKEVQKETRRRRSTAGRKSDVKATLSSYIEMETEAEEDGGEWHEHLSDDASKDEPEGFFSRITRRVIQDLIGIDDKLLEVIFGESLPDEEDLSSTPTPSTLLPSLQNILEPSAADMADSSWQLKVLDRLAKELGFLVNRLSEHPGAFSTYSRMQQMPIPYAGLPSIPESAQDLNQTMQMDTSTNMPQFKPTVKHVSPIDVPGVKGSFAMPSQSAKGEPTVNNNSGTTFTQDEWEQDLDIKLVFRYLRNRFLSRSNGSGSMTGSSHFVASSSQDNAANAARVRQHHPLVSRTRPIERRTFKATTPSSPIHFRHASSCASQSTRRSLRRSSFSSSRHYWDIGGSVGTGSMIATAGPMGSWGEV